MSTPQEPESLARPQTIHRNEASQAQVDQRMAAHAQAASEDRADDLGAPCGDGGQWEYRVADVREDAVYSPQGLSSAEDYCKRLGEQGWELVTAVRGSTKVYRLFFKRPKGAPAPWAQEAYGG